MCGRGASRTQTASCTKSSAIALNSFRHAITTKAGAVLHLPYTWASRGERFMHAALALALVTSLLAFPPTRMRTTRAVERIVINDNRTAGGTLRDGVLTIRLQAREGEWHPDGDHDPGLVAANSLLRFTINGKSWPHSEHLSYALGDTVHFRVINASTAVHPMHLHGFYFDVDSRGDGSVDSVYSSATPPYRVVTERSIAGSTFAMTWVPERAGNWLFHCHDNFHVLRNAPLDGSPLPAEHHVHTSDHARDMMGGLVMGIEVRGREHPGAHVAESARRKLHLVAQSISGGTDSEPSYGFALHDGTQSVTPNTQLLPA